jgi:murein DD-endopeptidase MepM/ murein hydrolase activator NlpD
VTRAWLAWLIVPFAWSPAAARVREARTATAVRAREAAPECETLRVGERCLPGPRCPAGELDLDGFCVPTGSAMGEDGVASVETNAHIDRGGRRVVYEHIPRRRDLPVDYDRYVYPVAPYGGHTVTSGYDLDLPDELQRRGRTLSAVGHGGVDLPQERGTPVKVVSLRGEVGEPEVLYVGPFFGNTVILRHVVREGSTARTYLALHGHLDAVAPDLRHGVTVLPGTVIGFVGDSGALGVIHLHYEIRLVRPGVDPARLDTPGRLLDQDVSVPCDPRNVLPLR